MIISKTPLRISLFGGGTDFPAFYKERPGEVVSFAIDKSIYVAVNKRFDGRLHLRYSHTEIGDVPDDLKHDIVRECLKMVGVEGGIEIVITSDVPAVGTGLGSSSALTVGLLKALLQYRFEKINDDILSNNLSIAKMACEIEINKVGSPIGKQDQYICAFGGFQHFTFKKDGYVENDLISGKDNYRRSINSILKQLSLFYIPQPRDSSEILRGYSNNIENNRVMLNNYLGLVGKFLSYLKSEIITDLELGAMLNTSWEIKKKCSQASNEWVEQAFLVAKENGGLGGKMCGAGCGGFLLMVDGSKGELVQAMENHGFKYTPFKLSEKGTHIIYKD